MSTSALNLWSNLVMTLWTMGSVYRCRLLTLKISLAAPFFCPNKRMVSDFERVLYEQVMRQLSGDGAPAQRLLLPLTLEFTEPELEAIDAHRELLARVGFEVEPFSGRTVVVHTAPNPHPRFEAARCLQELVSDLAGGRFGGWANRLERFGATFACRAAIKAGHHLDPDEARELVRRLLSATLPAHDVHGRPTIVQLPKGELERRFGR